ELGQRLLDVGGHVPDVGDALPTHHEADVDVVEIADHGDVQPRPLHDRAHREQRHELGAGEVERERRAGHVGDDEVVDHRAPVGQLYVLVEPHGQPEEAGGGDVGDAVEGVGAKGGVIVLGSLGYLGQRQRTDNRV